MKDGLVVALVSEVFHDAGGPTRLKGLLAEARGRGADLAVLPELPLHPWIPATRAASEEDAEPVRGTRHAFLAAAAEDAGIAVLGGAIVRHSVTGERHNTALLFDARGALRGSYAKLHLPDEEGFWEGAHYAPGHEAPRLTDLDGFPLGIQLCSDVNRPEGTHLLTAQGALAVLAPRATEPESWESWKLVLRANARTACCYVVSVNRPREERGVPLGGPSFVAGPSGEVVLETLEPLSLARLDRATVEAARARYPGYVAVRSEVYAAGWAALASPVRVDER
ncbi:MAG TPA: carbon-nitrogen hydrolase family protein [Candidatus Polarisedimenticolaceae bacterium]|nr:carbon-nitrogen hydrolase family protein [Candidatus Polarisedimenticolaceae bacterium]